MGTYEDTSLQANMPVELSQESFKISSNSTEFLSWNGDNDPENPYNWPTTKKWSLTCLAAFTTFLTMMNGTIITVAHFEISELFNIDETTFPHSYWPVTTWAMGGACSALFILPLAEDFGTRPVFLSTYSILICFLVPQAVAQSFATLVATRFFAGGCVAILANTAAGVMGNLWDTEWSRSVPVSLYILGYMAGSSMGPVMGAAIYQSLGWRWISYMQIVWFGALFPIYYFFFYESRGTAVLARREKTERKTQEDSGVSLMKSFSKILSQTVIPSAKRPVVLVFTEPVLFVSTMWSAFTVGTLFLFTQSVEQVYMELYDWDATQTGLVQAAIVVGELIGWALNLYLGNCTLDQHRGTPKFLEPRFPRQDFIWQLLAEFWVYRVACSHTPGLHIPIFIGLPQVSG